MRVSTEYNGHAIELEFDQSRVVINQAVLHVDGTEVDKTRVFYGEKDLRSTLEDGTEITVRLHSGMTGELTRAQLRRPDGSWVDLAS
jgi:hypothetical protein